VVGTLSLTPNSNGTIVAHMRIVADMYPDSNRIVWLATSASCAQANPMPLGSGFVPDSDPDCQSCTPSAYGPVETTQIAPAQSGQALTFYVTVLLSPAVGQSSVQATIQTGDISAVVYPSS
jgi:hypothetical protein